MIEPNSFRSLNKKFMGIGHAFGYIDLRLLNLR